MDGDFAVGLGFELVALGEELRAKVTEILDDAVMHDGDACVRMRMGVDRGRCAVRRPARVADAGAAGKRVLVAHGVELRGLSGWAAAFDRAGFDAVDVHMTDIAAGRRSLADFAGFAAGGGFSYGDVLGGGAGWAKSILFDTRLGDNCARIFPGPDTLALAM